MAATWVNLAVGAVVAVALVFGPGAAVAWGAGLRRGALWLAAPLVTFTLSALLTHGSAVVGVRYHFLTLLGSAAVLAGALALTRRVPQVAPWQGRWWWGLAPLVVAGLVHACRLGWAWQVPYAVSQTFDGPYHLNLVSQMLRDGDVSFLHVNLAAPDAGGAFFPTAWHAFVYLIVQLTGLPIPVAANAFTVVLTAFVWPLGCGLLVGALTRRWAAVGVTGLVAFTLPHLPNHFTWFGVLYSNLTGYVLVPFALGLAVLAAGRPAAQAWRCALVLAGGFLGLGVAHPTAVFAVLLFGVPLGAVAAGRRAAAWAGPGVGRQLAAGAAAAALVVGGALVVDRLTLRVEMLRSMRMAAGTWQPQGNWVQGVGRTLALAGDVQVRVAGPVAWALACLCLLGIVRCFTSWRTAWLPLAHAIAGFLFVASFSFVSSWRSYLVGLWYGDTQRLIALLAITAVPLIALGVDWLGLFIQGRVEALRPSPWAVAAPVALAVVVALGAQAAPRLQHSYWEIRSNFQFDTARPEILGLLSRDEYVLLERAARQLPADTVLTGNPWNGSVFAPAITGLRFTHSHVAPVEDKQARQLVETLNQARPGSPACELARQLHVTHVLDFGEDYLWGGDHYGKHEQFPGLEGLEAAGVAEVVDQEGAARLLHLRVCDEAP
ncbi:hypothetical protein EII12_07685 [Buchananella hordeovulneris]|uniref:DUF6541 family protein n=1 Tax=Buchananella hordeovulneris TaxID=52770 RepID=UPI000F5FDD5B|nr:DUF6541 family protein [Buchananella hordeovulneris]RRD51690.1 hypothetical protein EII12_07685 [Buchananella hordeovulneris]